MLLIQKRTVNSSLQSFSLIFPHTFTVRYLAKALNGLIFQSPPFLLTVVTTYTFPDGEAPMMAPTSLAARARTDLELPLMHSNPAQMGMTFIFLFWKEMQPAGCMRHFLARTVVNTAITWMVVQAGLIPMA